jgi:hypothetical protein
MKLINRIAYYLGGFAMGIILLFFFLSGKKTSCDYSPNARVLKNIRSKELKKSVMVLDALSNKSIDSLFFQQLLKNGNVDFSKSNTKLDSCKLYVIEDTYKETFYSVKIENCDATATVLSVDF